ncbi:MAG: disulfide bond formation protein B [Acidimicrobiia bacterium]
MPTFEVATNFFLVLTVVADVLVALALAGAMAAVFSSRARAAWRSLADALGTQALLVAWIVAFVTTVGSLYYSEHLGFVPCELCWYQRILMYPLTIVLGVGWLRRDTRSWMTAAPFVALGAPLSLYHWLVERVPSFAESSSCSIVAPCTAPYFERWGFVTLAWMCLSSFLLVGVLLVVTALARDGGEAAPSVIPAPRPEHDEEKVARA